jgi:deoxycytidylate deaminase
MNTIARRAFDHAHGAALASPGVGPRRGFRVGAAVFTNKKIISCRHNSYKTHPRIAQYTEWPHLHAEQAAVIAARDAAHGCSIAVVRIHKNGEFAPSRPCEICQEFLVDSGIREFYYIGEDGRFHREEVYTEEHE